MEKSTRHKSKGSLNSSSLNGAARVPTKSSGKRLRNNNMEADQCVEEIKNAFKTTDSDNDNLQRLALNSQPTGEKSDNEEDDMT